MALIAAAVGGLAAAGAGAYGASQAAGAQRDANRLQGAAYADNRRIQSQNSFLDAINSYRNWSQQQIDNRNYDQAVGREDAQRLFTNKLATAGTSDADGNRVSYDPVTNSWRSASTGLARDAQQTRQQLSANAGNAALVDSLVGGQQTADRRVATGHTQSMERALGDALLGRYAADPGRSRASMEGALITSNVADVTDPIQRNGGNALLAGYRQGNSGNDALVGALARNGQAGTRAAIAKSQLEAPDRSANSMDAQSKSLLGPAQSLLTRASADTGAGVPVFTGDVSQNLMASIQRGNAAGVGTSLNPRSPQAQVAQRPGSLQGFQPLNASGNGLAGMTESLQSLLRNPQLQQLVSSGWNSQFGDSSRGLNYKGGAGANSAIYRDPAPAQ